jgi:hypothetical protein
VPVEGQNDIDEQVQGENVRIIDLGNDKFENEEDELNLEKKEHQLMPEDEEFLRDLDRALLETFQVIVYHIYLYF